MVFPSRSIFAVIWSRLIRQTNFLSAINDGKYDYIAAPESALSFSSDDAQKLTRAEQGEVVVALFDFGSKLIVANVPDDTDLADNDAPAKH